MAGRAVSRYYLVIMLVMMHDRRQSSSPRTTSTKTNHEKIIYCDTLPTLEIILLSFTNEHRAIWRHDCGMCRRHGRSSQDMRDAQLKHAMRLLLPCPLRSVYPSPCRKLVLAFDVGTTNSGISYRWGFNNRSEAYRRTNHLLISVLDPGQVPEIKGVTG